ncbi:hypothetical protein BJ878DRAFT_223728 [Calycina marina]|uniref:Uncharacterized protein n=1 Tax=Calycina marina TaxID=1763456 RepID=A0A9P7YWY3_9HELO|nr:hypothetical protein BJ878DRAFT_223728 [Calycina marina]
MSSLHQDSTRMCIYLPPAPSRKGRKIYVAPRRSRIIPAHIILPERANIFEDAYSRHFVFVPAPAPKEKDDKTSDKILQKVGKISEMLEQKAHGQQIAAARAAGFKDGEAKREHKQMLGEKASWNDGKSVGFGGEGYWSDSYCSGGNNGGSHTRSRSPSPRPHPQPEPPRERRSSSLSDTVRLIMQRERSCEKLKQDIHCGVQAYDGVRRLDRDMLQIEREFGGTMMYLDDKQRQFQAVVCGVPLGASRRRAAGGWGWGGDWYCHRGGWL